MLLRFLTDAELQLVPECADRFILIAVLGHAAAAGFGNVQERLNTEHFRHILAAEDHLRGIACSRTELCIVLAAGGQARGMELLHHNAVRAGDDHILRHAQTVPAQNGAYRDRHFVAGADDRVGCIIGKEAFRDAVGAALLIIAVAEALLIKREMMPAQCRLI